MAGYYPLPAYRAPSAIDFTPLNEGIDAYNKKLERNRLLEQAQAVGAALAPDTAVPTAPNPLMAPQSVPASPAQASAAAAGRIIGAESGGDPNARNPNSSATGAGQFINSTWLDTVKRNRPDLANGKSDAEILSLRSNPNLSREMTGAYAAQNSKLLQSAGFASTPGNTYLAHFAGPGGAMAVLKADPSTPVTQILTPAAVAANPHIANMTAGDLRSWADGKMGGAPIAQAQAQAAPAPSGPNYRAAAAKAFEYGNIALGTQLLQQQTELDNQVYTRSHQAQQEAIGEQHWQAGNTRAEASASREAQTFADAQQKALEQKFGTIAQAIAAEPDPAKQKGMVDQLLSSHPEIAPGLQKYGVPLNDPAAVTKFLLAEAQGILPVQKPQFTKIGQDEFGRETYGWADPNTRTTTPAQGVAASAGPNPGTLHGEEFLKTLPTPMADQVKAYVEGRLAFPGGFALKSPYFQKMIQFVSQYDPNFDAVNYNARSKTRNDFTSGKSAQNITSFNTAIGHLGTLDKAIDGLNNSNYPYWNDITNYAAKQTGDTRFQKAESDFNTAKNAVVDELTRAFRGSGGSVHDIEGWEAQLKSAGSPATLHQAVKQAVELLRSRIEAVGDQYNRGMGTTADPLTLLNPKAQETIKRLSGEAAAGSASIPQGAIDLLRKDPSPDAVKEFNDTFGSDAARGVLGR